MSQFADVYIKTTVGMFIFEYIIDLASFIRICWVICTAV